MSIIVPTKNSQNFIGNCLESLSRQSYSNIEIIVVDNFSSDRTREIGKKYTNKVFQKGPERSAQRNFGARKSKGDYLLFVDSDMVVFEQVVEKCVEKVKKSGAEAVVIPEFSFGKGFWAKCKQLEKAIYMGDELIEAPRFFSKKAFEKVGGYDEQIISGEDWMLKEKIEKKHAIGRIEKPIYHNEGGLSFFRSLGKKYYYGKHFHHYRKKSAEAAARIDPLIRSKILLMKFNLYKKHPLVFAGLTVLKTGEFLAGRCGMIIAKFKNK